MYKAIIGLAMVFLALAMPAAASATPSDPAPRAWNNHYDCGKGYVDITVTVLSTDPSKTATYNVTLKPGEWGSRQITVPAGARRTVAFRLTANGVNTIVLTNTATGGQTRQPTDAPINCTSMNGARLPNAAPATASSVSALPQQVAAGPKSGLGAASGAHSQPKNWLTDKHPLFKIGVVLLVTTAFFGLCYMIYLMVPIRKPAT